MPESRFPETRRKSDVTLGRKHTLEELPKPESQGGFLFSTSNEQGELGAQPRPPSLPRLPQYRSL